VKRAANLQIDLLGDALLKNKKKKKKIIYYFLFVFLLGCQRDNV